MAEIQNMKKRYLALWGDLIAINIPKLRVISEMVIVVMSSIDIVVV